MSLNCEVVDSACTLKTLSLSLTHTRTPVTVQSLVQRSYNAFTVRVKNVVGTSSSSSSSPDVTGSRTISRTLKGEEKILVAAGDQDEEDDEDVGELCVELRIRLYPDGAMSKLLEQLPHVRAAGYLFFLVNGRSASVFI